MRTEALRNRLRGACLGGLLALAAAALPAARAGTFVSDAFDSSVLGRRVAYTAYLTSPDAPPRRVLYLLHGAGGDERSWLRDGAPAPALARALEALGPEPLAVVMPSLGPQSWWIDGASDAAATALTSELMPRAERRVGFAPHADAARAIAGVSMGGYGALSLALDHPDRFCAAALIGPAAYDPSPPAHSAARRSPQFADRDGAFDEAAWRRATPQSRLPAYAAQPRRVPMWIVSGDHDDLGIALQSAQLYERLRVLQPDRIELRIIDGGHDGPTFDAALGPALGYLGRWCRPRRATTDPGTWQRCRRDQRHASHCASRTRGSRRQPRCTSSRAAAAPCQRSASAASSTRAAPTR